VVLTYAPDGGQLTSVTQAGRTSTFAYGPNGLLVRATDALQRPTTYTYSSAQRLDSVTAPTTEVIRMASDVLPSALFDGFAIQLVDGCAAIEAFRCGSGRIRGHTAMRVRRRALGGRGKSRFGLEG
jgi:YD repeat-containing protein